jgi:hypothetical protein
MSKASSMEQEDTKKSEPSDIDESKLLSVSEMLSVANLEGEKRKGSKKLQRPSSVPPTKKLDDGVSN